ncbi:MAG: response regulator transcription factor [Bacteroidota bacterium]
MSLNLLIIDDDLGTTELLSLLLKTQGYEVMAANHGAEGVALAREAAPDLILLDMMMSEMDGWAVCREIRSFSSVPIIILSALNDPAIIAGILDAGADDYLTKPAVSAVLLAHIRRLARRSGSQSPSKASSQLLNVRPKTTPLVP